MAIFGALLTRKEISMKKTIAILMICVSLIACGGVSTEQLTKQVRIDLTKQFQDKADELGTTIKISSFGLIHKSGNAYTGLLETVENGKKFAYSIDVTYDGQNYMWKIVN